MKKQTLQHLQQLESALQKFDLWQTTPPAQAAFESTEPFAIDHLNSTEWLQWIFIPRMRALCESEQPLPHNMAITPYIEESLKEHEALEDVLAPLLALEALFKEKQA